MSTFWFQQQISLPAVRRGCHLVTGPIVEQLPDVRRLRIGWLQLFLLHTSASLTINENADPDVRQDMETALNLIAPEEMPFVHTIEGPDDMPAHVKSALVGCSVQIPIRAGRLWLGTWQGIYLCEHRDHGGRRQIAATGCGELLDSSG